MTHDIQDRLVSVFADVLGCDPNTLRTDDSNRTVEGWDSVNHVQLLLAIEDAFGVEFSPEEFASLTTVRALLERLSGAA